jgi:outer membrane protein assembly factor BamB
MKRLLSSLALLAVLASPTLSSAQRNSDFFQDARSPSTETLDRLNLTLNWSTFIPLVDRFDQIGSIQLNGKQLFVQTASGKLFVLNPANGEIIWKFTYPIGGQTVYPIAFTPERIFVVTGIKLYSFDRATGKTILDQTLPSTPATGPAADLTSVYIPLANNTIIGYSHAKLIFPIKPPPPREAEPVPQGISLNVPPFETLDTPQNKTPSVSMLATLKSPFGLPGIDAVISVTMLSSIRPPYEINGATAPSIAFQFPLTRLGELSELYVRDIMPEKMFEVQLGRGVASVPIVTKDNVLLPTLEQSVLTIQKLNGKQLFEFAPSSKISSPISVIGRYAFVATGDSTLYQVDTERLSQIWRYTGGAKINRKPFVADSVVFAAGSDAGIAMLDRESGEKIWQHKTADEILTMNPKYIYATDKSGKLHVIDRRRGIALSYLDVKPFQHTIVNEQDDRIYLGGRNGLILSLRDKEYRNPVPVITPPAPKKEPPKVVEEPKVEEPKKEPEKK